MKLIRSISILVLIAVFLGACSPAGQPSDIQATVLEVDPVERTYTLEAENNGLYLVVVTTDFNIDSIQAGDTLVLEITTSPFGDVVLVEVKEDPDAAVTELDDQAKNDSERGKWCDNGQPKRGDPCTS